ncbi:hypothetical protein LSCM1_07947 [Leishmania martiniquensis]|uniref:3-beta hydroxysteroid dehydrogenase/isomerase domain-containing protein n=1 Tax=Leishmania martiniquensis TaxID=1580590 RepID=A0A836KTI4_9TRYP|nr:hypothetical protein LSCM1_07947 [Leishmania martiniquensis]
MPPKELNPLLSPQQKRAANQSYPEVPKKCVVTGGTGFVGTRLVEMLIERGAERVLCFDIVPKEKAVGVWDHPSIEYVVGDITSYSDVSAAVKGSDCVWHLAAAVGPFHPRTLYKRVNHGGTMNVIRACKEHGVKKMIFSSSPSTRFKGTLFHRPNVDGLTEDEMPKLPLEHYMQVYAQTKAEGEMATRESIDDNFWSIAVAPHQVYGPRDNLFLPNMLEAAGTGKLRVFGKGDNRICFSHVDNYCHGLIIAEKQLYKDSPYLGRFYIVTDANTHPEPAAYCFFWKELDKAIVGMGFASIMKKAHYPFWFLYIAALFAELAGWIMNTTFKLNVFNVFLLTMNRWFRIDAAENDLKYQPVIPFEDGWNDTIEWFRLNWLPKFNKQDCSTIAGISAGSQLKINIQAQKEK